MGTRRKSKTSKAGKYFDQYKQLHAQKRYGVSGDHLVQELKQHISEDCESLLDYGAGQSNTAKLLKKELGLKRVREYDPCVPGRDAPVQENYDCVICTDVLEHIPEDELNTLLTDVWGIAEKEAIFVVALREAAQVLPNGENAHCTVHPKEWWEKRLGDVFTNVIYVQSPSKPHWTAWFKCSS